MVVCEASAAPHADTAGLSNAVCADLTTQRLRRTPSRIKRSPHDLSKTARQRESAGCSRRARLLWRQIRDRIFENQSFRASSLSLITAAIVH
jgi:hypothetical protein